MTAQIGRDLNPGVAVMTTYACGCQVRTDPDGSQTVAGVCPPGSMCCRPIHLEPQR